MLIIPGASKKREKRGCLGAPPSPLEPKLLLLSYIFVLRVGSHGPRLGLGSGGEEGDDAAGDAQGQHVVHGRGEPPGRKGRMMEGRIRERVGKTVDQLSILPLRPQTFYIDT